MFKHYLVDFHITFFLYTYLTFKALQDKSYVFFCIQMLPSQSWDTDAPNVTNK